MGNTLDNYKTIHAPSGIFKFKNRLCECVIDLRHDDYGNPNYFLKIKNIDDVVEMRHHFKEGIKIVNDHGDNHHTPLLDMPHSQECLEIYDILGIKSDVPRLSRDSVDEKSLADKLKKYFQKYGFLFPLFDDEYCIEMGLYTEFKPLNIVRLFDRISILLALMNAVDGTDVDYNSIFNLTFMLALKKLDKFTNLDNSQTYFEEFSHPMHKTFTNIELGTNNLNADIIDEMELPQVYGLELLTERLENSGIDYNTGYSIVDGEGVAPDRYYEILVADDYFLGNNEKFFVRVSDYEDVLGESEYYNAETMARHKYYTEKRIKHMFLSNNGKARSEKLFYDFLFHLHFQAFKIKSISPNLRFPVQFEDDIDLNRNEKFNDKFKSILRELANITIKNELDFMTSFIHTDYDIENMTQGWKIPNLFTAIYYSIFLTDRHNEVYRVCANPYCRGNFPVAVTNDRRKYCSENCQRMSAQRLKRASDNLKAGEYKVAVEVK